MMKLSIKQKIAITLLFLAIIFLGVLQYLMPKQADWNISLLKNDSQPFGCEVLYKRIPDIFTEIRNNNLPYSDLDTNDRNQLFFIITNSFSPTTDETEELMRYASAGNTVYLATMNFSKSWGDTLHIKVNENWNSLSFPILFLSNSKFDSLRFTTPYGVFKKSIECLDSLKPKVISMHEDGKPIAIEMPIGKGQIIVDLAPYMFTNFGLLYSSPRYAEAMFNRVGTNSLLWDNYYEQKDNRKGSVLSYVLKNRSLLAAYLLTIVSFLLAIIFGFRRVARPIPIIEPLRNASVDLAFSIGMLWYNQSNNKTIALRKWKYVQEQIYEKIKIHWKSELQTIELIAIKLGKDKQLLLDIDMLAKAIESKGSISNAELKEFYFKTKKIFNR